MSTRVTCPHCSAVIPNDPSGLPFSEVCQADADGFIGVDFQLAPCCSRYVVHLTDGRGNRPLVWPTAAVGRPVSELIPARYAGDLKEACAVLPLSPKASAALARRCLRHFLEVEAGADPRDVLEKQIRDATGRTPRVFPPRLAARLDHVRVIGNFAAHPKENTSTGEVVEVEPDEAAYLLDVLVEVFVHWFVEPVADAARAAAVEAKLASTRRPSKS